MAKDNMMKYILNPVDMSKISDEEFQKLHDEFFTEDLLELNKHLAKFKDLMFHEYIRFYIANKDPNKQANQKAELIMHQEIKKHRKAFNHNIQELSKRKKFSLIKNLTGRIKEYQVN